MLPVARTWFEFVPIQVKVMLNFRAEKVILRLDSLTAPCCEDRAGYSSRSNRQNSTIHSIKNKVVII